jgi:hypothetical protein
MPKSEPKVIDTLTTRSAVGHLAPSIVMVFGLGWLIGSGGSWYWGLTILCVSVVWQLARSSDENEEEKA